MGVIPGGCTKLVKPIDVSLNELVKSGYFEKYENWFSKGEIEYTRGGNVTPPSYKKQIEWVLNSRQNIRTDVVIFNICGITQSDPNYIHCVKPEHPANAAFHEINRRIAELGNSALVDEECFIVERRMDDYDDNDVIEELPISDEDLEQMEGLDVPAHLQEILDV